MAGRHNYHFAAIHVSAATIASTINHGGTVPLAWHIAMVNFNADTRRRIVLGPAIRQPQASARVQRLALTSPAPSGRCELSWLVARKRSACQQKPTGEIPGCGGKFLGRPRLYFQDLTGRRSLHASKKIVLDFACVDWDCRHHCSSI